MSGIAFGPVTFDTCSMGNVTPKLSLQNFATCPSVGSSCLKSRDGTPSTVTPSARRDFHTASRPENCGVNPQ